MTLPSNERRFRIYLADHLALMLGEVELVQRCQRNNAETPLGEFLEQLLLEVKAQRSVVKDVNHRFGGRESLLKDSGAWLAEKLGRLKLNDALITYSSLSRVIELEALFAMAYSRVALWETIEAVGEKDQRLSGITFDIFKQEAHEHADELASQRKRAAEESFE